jgi:hypothetical protein
VGWLELYDINDPMMKEMYNYLVTQIKPRTLENIKKEALQYHEKLRAVK